MRPLIFVTNDDGITAKGIQALIEVVAELGDLVIIAPDKAQSGMGHAITVHFPLRLEQSTLYGTHKAYSCTGTPVDCVKLGISHVMHRKPDLIVSGINHGDNASSNVLYSGTMSAAVEGAMENIPSIGFSLGDFNADADFTEAQTYVKTIVQRVLKEGMPNHVCLNVNFPKRSHEPLKGIKICRQAHAFWEDRFDERKDQFNRSYFWLTGAFKNSDQGDDTDLWALDNGFISVVPIQFDLTAYQVMNKYKKWEK